MAILFTDGFDLYGSATGTNMATRWTSVASATMSTTTPYNSGQSVSVQSGTGNTIVITPVSDFSTGFALRFNNGMALGWSGSVNYTAIWAWALSGATYMIGLQFNSDGSVQVHRQTGGNSGTVLGVSAAGVIKNLTWHYVELSISISDTVGTVRVDVDGATVINLTNQDTRNGTPTTIDRITYSSSSNSLVWLYDDLYISDSATPLGPRRIYTLLPSADTAEKDWVASTGVDNYAMVDDALVDGDTTYVQGSVVGDFDLYDVGNLTPASATISAVNHLVWARKTDATTRAINLTTKSNTTTTDSANTTLSTSYAGYSKIYDTDPDTASAWTVSGVNALQIGQKIAI